MLVLFFKQKTAYEMRISDWSSDVCSSDLISPVFSGPARIFLYRAILFNAAGCALGGDKSNLSLYKELSAYNSIIIKTIIYILRYLPNKILEKLRKIRHRSRSEEHTSELQSLMRISYAVFCLKKKKNTKNKTK